MIDLNNIPFNVIIFKELLSFKSRWKGETLLDVGCGLGDLFHYIKKHNINLKYKGADTSTELINAAKRAYPGGYFFRYDLFVDQAIEQADVVVASGLFNLRMGKKSQQLDFLKEGITQLLKLSKEGVVFNLLEENNITKKIKSTEFFYYKKEEIKTMCTTFSTHVKISQDYLINDMTIKLKI